MRMKVLLVEDDAATAYLVTDMLLAGGGVDVGIASSLTEAMTTLGEVRPDVVVLDLGLPDTDGSVRSMRRAHPDVPIVVLSGMPQDQVIRTALEDGAQVALSKSDVDAHLLRRGIDLAITRLMPDQQLEHTQRLAQLLRASTATVVGQRIQQTLDAARETFGLDLGIISRVDGEDYVVEYVSGPGVEVGTTFEVGKTYCALTVDEGDVVAIDHMGVSAYSGHPCYAELGLESYIGVPLMVSGARYGTVNFSSAWPHARGWTIHDADYMRHVAGLFGRWVEEDLTRRALADVTSELEQQALTDALTGLGNRTMLGVRLERQLRIDTLQGRHTAVLYLDLDGFKQVNDQFGHGIGDKVLREIAGRLKDVLRPDDIITRVGGDEFVAVLAGPVDADTAHLVANRLVRTVRRPVSPHGFPVTLGMSVGVRMVQPGSGETPAEAVKRADQAMYAAKAAGKNQVRWSR